MKDWTEWGYNNVAGRCSKCGDSQQTRKWVTTKPQSCGGTCPQHNGKLSKICRRIDMGCYENCEFGYKTRVIKIVTKSTATICLQMEFPYVGLQMWRYLCIN